MLRKKNINNVKSRWPCRSWAAFLPTALRHNRHCEWLTRIIAQTMYFYSSKYLLNMQLASWNKIYKIFINILEDKYNWPKPKNPEFRNAFLLTGNGITKQIFIWKMLRMLQRNTLWCKEQFSNAIFLAGNGITKWKITLEYIRARHIMRYRIKINI